MRSDNGDRSVHDGVSVPEEAFNALRERFAEIEAEVIDDLGRIGSYGPVTHRELRTSLEANMGALIRAVRTGDSQPSSDYLEELTHRTRERFDAGVRSDDLIRGYRSAMLAIQQLFADVCESMGVSAELLYRVFRIMLVHSDAMVTHVSVQFQRYMVEKQVADASRTLVFVEQLLSGRADPAQVATHCREYGLDPQERFRVFLAWSESGSPDRPSPGGRSPATIAETMMKEMGAGSLAVARRGLCFGLTPGSLPELPGVDAAVGPALPLSAADRAGALAEMTRAWMLENSVDGVVEFDRPGWKLLIGTEPELSEAYSETVIRPVEEHGASGRTVLVTVAAFIRGGQAVRETADGLYVHENTLRYRLKRFGELTGEDLSRPDSFVRVVWALTAAGYLE